MLKCGTAPLGPRGRSAPSLRGADPHDRCPAHRALALHRRLSVLHLDLLRILDLSLRATLHAVALDHARLTGPRTAASPDNYILFQIFMRPPPGVLRFLWDVFLFIGKTYIMRG